MEARKNFEFGVNIPSRIAEIFGQKARKSRTDGSTEFSNRRRIIIDKESTAYTAATLTRGFFYSRDA